ncbi:MAG: 4Fe-4S binding protein [Candidatus Helarchaeota archaeon]
MGVPYEQLIHKEGDPGDFIKVEREKCIACKKCLIACPLNLWYMDDGKANIREKYKEICLECASCWQVCDYGAIIFNYPKGGTGVVFKHG